MMLHHDRGWRSHWLATVSLLLTWGLASVASAVDGVIEISHQAALVGGVTPGDLAGYPVTLSEPGSYRLTTDLVIPSTAGLRGIEVTAGPMTLDLNGFAIRGPGTCSGVPPVCSGNLATVGVEVSSPEVVRMRNGTITGTLTAIFVPQTGADRSLDLRDLALVENGGTAVILSGAGASVVSRCRIDRNGIDGIDIPILQAAVISETSFRSNGNIAVNSDGAATLVQESQFIGNGVGIRSFFLSNPSNALAYRANMFSANGTNLIGGFSLGANYCSGVAC